MSTDNRIKKDIGRCEEAVHAANTLMGENLYSESISRAYYAVIHSIMILLAYAGTDTKVPQEAEKLFTPSFLKDNGIPLRLHAIFTEVRKAKEESAHDYLYKYSGEAARDIVAKARTFLDITRKHLGI